MAIEPHVGACRSPKSARMSPTPGGIVRVPARRLAGTRCDVCDITSRCVGWRPSGARGHTVVSKWWWAGPERLSAGRTSGRIVTEPHGLSSVSRSSGTSPASRATRAPQMLRATLTRVGRESNPSPALWDSAQCP